MKLNDNDKNVLRTRNLFPHPQIKKQTFLDYINEIGAPKENGKIKKIKQFQPTGIPDKPRKHKKNFYWTITAQMSGKKILLTIEFDGEIIKKFAMEPHAVLKCVLKKGALKFKTKIRINEFNSFNEYLLYQECNNLFFTISKILSTKKLLKKLIKNKKTGEQKYFYEKSL